MPAQAIVKSVSSAQLQSALTRCVAEWLVAAAKTLPAAKRTRRGSPEASPAAAHNSAGPDLDVVIDGEHFLIEAKAAPLSGQDLLEAVYAASGDLLGSSNLFILQETDPAVMKVVSALLEQLPDIVARRRQALSERNIEALVDVFLGTDPLAPVMPLIERDNARAQASFLEHWPVLTAEAVAKQAGHASTNRSATASRWKSAGRIFSVRSSGHEVFPVFQFQEGRPRKVIGEILSALPDTLSGWQTAFWFTGPNSWLDDKAPVDRLNDEAAVITAAEHERDVWMG
jgi:hypothetical protein